MLQIKTIIQKIVLFFSLASIVFFSTETCKAGGNSYLFEIKNLQSKGNNQYKIILKCLDKDAPGCKQSNQLIIHLRFNKAAFGNNVYPRITLENYLNCISKLKEQFRKGGSFRFGFVGVGIIPISGRKGEYQSNALVEEEEFDGNMTIYSFARPI